MIYIQHRTLGSFEQYVLALVQHVVDEDGRVADVLAVLLSPSDEPLLELLLGALAGLGPHELHEVLLHREHELGLLPDELGLQQVSCPESVPGDLVLVGGTDTFLGGTHGFLPL